MNQQSKSNKPSWDDAPEWANWLACDKCGVWYWYINEPDIPDGSNFWNNSDSSLCDRADGFESDLSWSRDNWESSLEERPSHSAPNPYLSSPDKKRVTLFIDFENDSVSDEDIASYVSTLLADDLSDTDTYIANVVVAVGVTKMAEVTRNDDFEFSSRMIKISSNEPQGEQA